ncbi:UNVERIFIED_CONTAM: hypothetical protein HDU68_000034 [Siphonaria sp. JEL0065]|nr:hypothetical protein HDU68_000034 [Siphonaria sp. JEL0065]
MPKLLEGGPTTADCAGMELEQIKDLPSTLRRLDISDNLLASGSVDFTTATNLTWLDLKQNKLSTLAGLETLKAIQILNLGANKLQSIASIASFGANLKALIINNNFLTTLPDLSPLTNLNTLVLSHNNLTSLPKPFPRLPQLKKLSISNNQLTEYPTFTIPPPPIQELRLSHNQIKSLPIKNPKSYSTYAISGLKTLDLGSNSLESLENLTASLAILAGTDTIVNLNLKGNPVVGGAGGEDVYKHAVIKASGSSLKVLDGVRFDAKFLERKEKRKESGWLLKRQQGDDDEEEEEGDSPSAKAAKPKDTKSFKKDTGVSPGNLKKLHPSGGITKRPTMKPDAGKSDKKIVERKLVTGSPKLESSAPKSSFVGGKKKPSTETLKPTRKSNSAPTSSNPLKRKAEGDSNGPKKSSKSDTTDNFFKESFKPKASTTVAKATTTTTAEAVKPTEKKVVDIEAKKEEKKLDKFEEKLRSGVVGVVEVKATVKKSGGGKIIKNLKAEDLEKATAVSSAFGTGLAPGWD